MSGNEREGLRGVLWKHGIRSDGHADEILDDLLSLLTQAQETESVVRVDPTMLAFLKSSQNRVGADGVPLYASPVASAPEPVVTLDKICRYLADAYARGAAAQREGDLPDTTEGLIAESEAWANKFVDTRLAHGLIPTPARASAPEPDVEDVLHDAGYEIADVGRPEVTTGCNECGRDVEAINGVCIRCAAKTAPTYWEGDE